MIKFKKKNINKKIFNLIFIIILIISFLLQILTLSNGHEWGDDFALYIMQAISIIEKSELTLINKNLFMLTESSKVGGGPLLYPWGFPALISPIYNFFGINIFAFKLLNVFFFSGFLVLCWFFFKNKLTLLERSLLVSFFAFNPFLLKFNDQVLSDISFLFFSFLSIFTIYLFFRKKNFFLVIIFAILLGLLFAISFLIRFHGIILPAIYIVILLSFIFNKFLNNISPQFSFTHEIKSTDCFIFNKNFLLKSFLLLMPIIFFGIFILIANKLFPSVDIFTFNIYSNRINYEKILYNFFYNLIVLRFFFNESYLGLILFIITLPFAVIGFYKRFQNSIILVIYTILTFFLYTIHPFNQGLRFFISILPFYIFFLFIGLRVFKKFTGNFKYLKFLFIYIYLFFFIFKSSLQINNNFSNRRMLIDGPLTADAILMFEYIKKNVSKEEIVVFRKPRAMRLFTKKNALYYASINDFKFKHWYVLDKYNIEPIDQKKNLLFFSYPALLMFENSQFEVYKFK